jgi:O-antigen/teichoic acid export membrane protein
LDQGLLSGANFALSLCYARWLVPDQYGVFAILLAVFLFLSGFHNAMLLEPMSVLGPSTENATRRKYIGALIPMHCAVTAVLGILAATAGAILRARNESLGKGVEVVGFTLPLILLYWLLRRACYLRGDARHAAKASLAYACGLIATLSLPRALHSPAFGMVCMAGASVLGSIVAFRREDHSWQLEGFAALLKTHWQYGRWVLGVSLIFWLTGPFFAPILGYFDSLSSAATYRAAENLLSPLGQIITALSLLMLPWISGQMARVGPGSLQRLTARASIAGLIISGCYAACILSAGRFLIGRLYAGHAYDRAAAFLPVLCIASIARSTTDLGVGLSLKAISRPDATFWAAAAAAICSVTIGVGLIRSYGPAGAAWASLLASGIQSGILISYFLRLPTSQRQDIKTADLEAARVSEAF